MKEELRMLKAANAELRDMIKDLEKKWVDREEEMVRNISEKVMENIEEMQGRERRKNNVCVYCAREQEG